VSTTIQPERVLKELAELWVTLGKESDPSHSSGVLRACAMTLITLVEESEDPSDVWSTMAALMPEHPSRAIVIRFKQSAARELSSRVFSQCWMPFGHRRQICCEQIEISASDASLPELAPVVLPLAVADLPVVLWCRSARLFRLPEFPQLAKIANKLLLDSSAFADPAGILARIQSGQKVVSDLAWTRLTRVRELISQIFESRSYLSRVPEVALVKLTFGGVIPPVSAFYLAAWILDCLEAAGAHPYLEWERAAGVPAGRISRLELAGESDSGLHVTLTISGDPARQMAELQIDSLVTNTVFPTDNDYALLREELSIPGRDAVYERTLARAARLAGQGK